MKKKQQFEQSISGGNKLINRLYRSRPKALKQEQDFGMSTEEKQLVPKINFKQKLAPLETPTANPHFLSFLDKKSTDNRHTLHRSTSRARSRIYSQIQGFEDQKLPPISTLQTQRIQKTQTNYLTPEDFMQILKLDKDMSEEFCYLKKKDNPYNWEIVDFDSRDPSDYMVISKRGLTRYVHNRPEFMSFDAFTNEAKQFQKLMQIDYFKSYKRWKNFSLWKRLTKLSRLRQTIRTVETISLLSDQVMKESLASIQNKCKDIEQQSIFYHQIMAVRSLNEFKSYVLENRKTAETAIEAFHKWVNETLMDTCKRSMELFTKRMRINRQKSQNPAEGRKVALVIGDDMARQMPHTEEATIKTQQIKLRNFIKLTDYLILTAKIELFANVSRILLKVVNEMNSHFGSKVGKTYGKSPWIRVQVHEQQGAIYFYPPRSDVIETFLQIIFQCMVEVCKSHIQFLHLPAFRTFSILRDSDQLDERIDLYNLININPKFVKIIAQLKTSLNLAFTNIEKHTLLLEESLQFVSRVRQLLKQPLNDKDSEFFRNILVDVKESSQKMKTIEVQTEIGLLLFDCSHYKAAVEKTVSQLMYMFSQLIPQLLHGRSVSILRQINSYYELVKETPTDLENYFSFLDNVKMVNDETDNIQPKINDNIYLLSLAQQFGVKITEVSRLEVSDVNGQMIGLKRRLEEVAGNSQALLETFKKEVQRLVPLLVEKFKNHQDKLSELAVFKNRDNLYEQVSNLSALSKSLNQLNLERAALNKYQMSLSIQETPFEQFKAYSYRFGLIEKMWKTKYDWQLLIRNNNKLQIKELKLGAIQHKMEECQKNIEQCQKELDPNEVVIEIKNQVQKYKPIYSVLVSLNDQALLPNHVEEIRKLALEEIQNQPQIELKPEVLDNLLKSLTSQDLTTQLITTIRLWKRAAEIQEIAYKAKQEAQLLKLLTQLEAFWKGNNLQVLWHRDSKQVTVLGNNDQFISKAEENLVTANTILSNKYIGFIRQRAETQQKMLKYIQQLMDEWYEHQNTWIYLEPIFKSTLAIKNLPKEAATFAQADNVWRRIMKQTRDNPSAKKFGDDHQPKNILHQLKNNNNIYQMLQKSLEQFLQKKREIFGRFFLLSNFQLLQILSNVKEHTDLQYYIERVFRHVRKLTMDQHNNITSLVGDSGDVLPLRNCLMKGDVEDWFKAVEDAMKQSLKIILKSEIATQNSETIDRLTWIQGNPPCQILLVVDYLSWTSSTEAFIQNQDMDLYEWFETINNSITEQIGLLKKKEGSVKRDNLISLIVQNTLQRDFIQSILDCRSKDDFRWQAKMRFYFEDDQLVAKVAKISTPYSYEFVGPYSVFASAQTEKYYLNILQCMFQQKVAILQGNIGKTETYKQLALALAKNLTTFQCSSEFSGMIIGRLFAGITYTGSWACFQEITRMNEQVLSLMAQHLGRIRQAVMANMREVKLGDRVLHLNYDFGLVFTSQKQHIRLPENILSKTRTVSVCMPHASTIIEGYLAVNGVENPKDVAQRLIRFLEYASNQIKGPEINLNFRTLLLIGKQIFTSLMNKSQSLSVIVGNALISVLLPSLTPHQSQTFRHLIAEAFPIKEDTTNFDEIRKKLQENSLIENETIVLKTRQLVETAQLRNAIVVGAPASGKSTIIKLAYGDPTKIYVNCFSQQELYGQNDSLNGNWKEGLIPKQLKNIARESKTTFVFEGQLSGSWCERFCSLLDYPNTLMLANSEQISYSTQQVNILFQSENLKDACPSLVSRCGIVSMARDSVSPQNIIDTYVFSQDEKIQSHISGLVKFSLKKGVPAIKKSCQEAISVPTVGLLHTYCKLIQSLMVNQSAATCLVKETWKKVTQKICIFAFVWSFGSVVSGRSRQKVDKCLSQCFSSEQLKAPMYNYDLSFAKNEGQWVLWSSYAASYQPHGVKYVPTKEVSIMKNYLILMKDKLQPVMLMAPAGTGKSALIRQFLEEQQDQATHMDFLLTHNHQSNRLQQAMEMRLQPQRRLGVVSLLPPPGKKLLIVIDDRNMAYQTCHSTLELIRSIIQRNQVWDRQGWYVKLLHNCQTLFSLSSIQTADFSQQLTRHMNILHMPQLEQESVQFILNTFTKSLPVTNTTVENYLDSRCIASAIINLFKDIPNCIKITGSQPQLQFNLHHMIDILQGIERAFNPNKDLTVNEVDTLIRLWLHQVQQVITKRLPMEQPALTEAITKQLLITMKYSKDPLQLMKEQTTFCPLNINHYYSYVRDNTQLRNSIQNSVGSYYVISDYFNQHLMTAVRSLSTTSGCYLAIGPSKKGRKSAIRAASQLLSLKMYEIQDETSVSDLLRKMCQDKAPCVVLLDNPEVGVLEQLLQLPIVSKQQMDEVNKITNSKAFQQIIENYFHLAVVLDDSKYLKLLSSLPSLINRFNIDCWAEPTSGQLQEIAKQISDVDSQMAIQMYGEMNCQNIGCFIDIFKMYRHHVEKMEWLAERRVVSLDKAIKKYQDTQVKLEKLSKQLEEDQTTLAQNILIQQKLFKELGSKQAVGSKNKASLDLEQAQLSELRQKFDTMKQETDVMHNQVVSPIELCTNAICNLSRNDMSEMRQLYTSPNAPADLKFALECIAISMQEREEPQQIKKMINDQAFLQKFKQFDLYNINKKVIQNLKNKLSSNPSFKPSEMKAVSLAVKLFCQWSWHIVNFQENYKNVEQAKQKLAKQKQTVDAMANKISNNEQILQTLNKEIREKEAEYQGYIRKSEQLRMNIEKQTRQIQNGDELRAFTASFPEKWKTALVKAQQHQKNIKQSLFLSCCQLVLTADISIEEAAKFKNRSQTDYSIESLFGQQLQLRRCFLQNSFHLDETTTNRIIYIQNSVYPLTIRDQYEYGINILKLYDPSNVFLQFSSATFENDFNMAMRLEKTVCFIITKSIQEYHAAQNLLNWNFFEAPRPKFANMNQVVSPSFRWHIIAHFNIPSRGGSVSGLNRQLSLTPSETVLKLYIYNKINKNQLYSKLVEEYHTESLQKISAIGNIQQSEQFITQCYDSIASQIYDQPDLIQKISQHHKTIIEQTEASLKNINSLPYDDDTVGCLVRLFELIHRVKHISIDKFIDLCMQVEAVKKHGFLQQLSQKLIRNLMTEGELLALFVAYSKLQINQLDRQTQSLIQGLSKEDRLNYEVNPTEWLKKTNSSTDSTELMKLAIISRKNVRKTVEVFVKESLGIDIRQMKPYMTYPEILQSTQSQIVDVLKAHHSTDTAESLCLIALQTNTRFKIYSMKTNREKLKTAIQKTMNQGYWSLIENCQLDETLARDIQKRQGRYRLILVFNRGLVSRVLQPENDTDEDILDALSPYSSEQTHNIFQEAEKFCQLALKRMPLVIKKKAENTKSTVATLTDLIEAHLVEEADSYSKIIKEFQNQLRMTEATIKGQLTLSKNTYDALKSISRNIVPASWRLLLPDTTNNLQELLDEFVRRAELLRSYLNEKTKIYDLSILQNPEKFIHLVLVYEAKRKKTTTSQLNLESYFRADVQKQLNEQDCIFVRIGFTKGFVVDIKSQTVRKSEDKLYNTCPVIQFKATDKVAHDTFLPIPLKLKNKTNYMHINCKMNDKVEPVDTTQWCFTRS